MKKCFFDTETTGIGPNDEIIQVCVSEDGEKAYSRLYKPSKEIELTAMAVHHITNTHVQNAPCFQQGDSIFDGISRLIDSDTVFVAHNAPFDIGMIERSGLSIKKFICTYRVAEHLLDLENYSLQYLRYYFTVDKNLKDFEIKPHDAESDVIVLREVYNALSSIIREKSHMTTDEEVEQWMIEHSIKIPLMRRFHFGKYRGEYICEVVAKDRGYLEWLSASERKKPEKERNEKLLNTLEYHLNVANA